MKKTSLLITALVLMISTTLTFCKKEPIRGCTNDKADNYKSSADEDDGSCTYKAKVVFYLTPSKGSLLSSTGASSIKLYVNGSYAGTLNNNNTRSTAPDCDASTNVIKKEFTTKTYPINYTITVEDEDGFVWIEEQEFKNATPAADGECNVIYW